MSLSSRVFVIGRQSTRRAADAGVAWRALRALCIIPTIPNRGRVAKRLALPVQWRGRLVEASVGAGLAPSGMGCDARDGAERLRTHPAAREAQLTCTPVDCWLAGWLLEMKTKRGSARASEHSSTPTHTPRPRRLHLRTTLYILLPLPLLISTHTHNTHNCWTATQTQTLLPRLQLMALQSRPDISPIIARSSR